MVKNSNIKRKLLQQKKLLLLNMYAFSLFASSISPSVKSSNSNNISTGIVSDAEKTYTNGEEHKAGVVSLCYAGKENIEQKKKMFYEQATEIKQVKMEPKTIYYDFPCENKLQDHIFKMSKKYNVPHEIIMVIIHRESGGKWNTNGVISPTEDYGLAQINICNAEYIKENLGFSLDEILNDPYKSIEAQTFLLNDIINIYGYTDNLDLENIFGTYNGWLDWEKSSDACEYAEACMQIYDEKFGGYTRKLN